MSCSRIICDISTRINNGLQLYEEFDSLVVFNGIDKRTEDIFTKAAILS